MAEGNWRVRRTLLYRQIEEDFEIQRECFRPYLCTCAFLFLLLYPFHTLISFPYFFHVPFPYFSVYNNENIYPCYVLRYFDVSIAHISSTSEMCLMVAHFAIRCVCWELSSLWEWNQTLNWLLYKTLCDRFEGTMNTDAYTEWFYFVAIWISVWSLNKQSHEHKRQNLKCVINLCSIYIKAQC